MRSNLTVTKECDVSCHNGGKSRKSELPTDGTIWVRIVGAEISTVDFLRKLMFTVRPTSFNKAAW
jgi:hypothetical protein